MNTYNGRLSIIYRLLAGIVLLSNYSYAVKNSDAFVPVYPTNGKGTDKVKIWEIRYPSDIKENLKYLATGAWKIRIGMLCWMHYPYRLRGIECQNKRLFKMN